METEKLMDEIDLILKTSKAGTMSTSVSPTVSEYMTFYIKDYALYTETEKNSPIISGIEYNPLVHITLGDEQQSDSHLEIVGETEVVTDQEIIDWLAQEKGPLTVAADIVMLKVIALKVKLVGE
ncbi:pyridoxamine 5-phosphate oxidase [Salinicoccus roseus]|uniref:pyridoxamine 5'-phosphate oxidase family protein n=1 Tax=Salinicoccus roseus TaxID=45670 RepID=UPI002300E3BD|nr:pyridoxamine 5-phosphate oxidase [Salinicoccus roseus]